MYSKLIKKGYVYLPATKTAEQAVLLKKLRKNNYVISRDTVISNKTEKGDLVAPHDDFWFHTDATFQKKPPKYIGIQVLKSEGGGKLELFDSNNIINIVDNSLCRFGTSENNAIFPIKEMTDDGLIFRYRKDYMNFVDGQPETNLHSLIENMSANNAISIGEMSVGDMLIVNNWRFLHRRAPFRGERTIRRLWIQKE